MIINLIAGPRNVSTALMYSFAQRSDTQVIDEPFYAYYLKETGSIHPGRDEILQSMSADLNEVLADIKMKNPPKGILFLKNMAHHHININLSFLLSVKNIFLIRHPAQLLASFAKVIDKPTLNDIGIKKSWELFHQLRATNQQPVVIDSGELLKDPSVMLQKLCLALQSPFSKDMLSWPAGPRPEEGAWARFWYQSLHKTTGFKKRIPQKITLPKHLQNVYDEAMTYYDKLYVQSLKY